MTTQEYLTTTVAEPAPSTSIAETVCLPDLPTQAAPLADYDPFDVDPGDVDDK